MIKINEIVEYEGNEYIVCSENPEANDEFILGREIEGEKTKWQEQQSTLRN